MALRGGDGDGQHDLDVVEALAGQADEAELDVEDDLSGDQQVVVECQRVLGEVDDSLDGVLDRHHAVVEVTGGDSVEDVGHGRVVDQLTGGEIGLRAQRLLGERAERPEEPDAQRCHAREATWPGAPPSGRESCLGGNRPGLRHTSRPDTDPAQRRGPGTMGAWTNRRCGCCSTSWRRGTSTPTRSCGGCSACRSPMSATPSSTTTGRYAKGFPRRSTGRARRRSSACASSVNCSTTARRPCC